MPDTRTLTFYHAPNTRSGGVRVLLEEIGAPYDLVVLSLKKGENRQPAYLAINPMGKVPAIKHGDAVVTEATAIYPYLADAFPSANLAPPIGDPLRGPYLRWIAFYGACLEPAVTDRSMGREPPPLSRSGYGSYDLVLSTLNAQIAANAFIAGDRFTAADLLWHVALRWLTGFGVVPKTPTIANYIERTHRPAYDRAMAADAALAAKLDAA